MLTTLQGRTGAPKRLKSVGAFRNITFSLLPCQGLLEAPLSIAMR
jgi:hypothetical protein